MPVFLLWGEEEFTLREHLNSMKNKIIDPAWASLNYKQMDEPDLSQLIEAMRTVPLGFGDMCIEVRTTSLFFRGKKKKTSTEDQIKKFISALENIDNRINLIFVCELPRDSGQKIDSVSRLTKAVQKTGTIKHFDAFKYYQTKELSEWIGKQTKTKGGEISAKAALELINSTGTDLRRLDTEIDKLLLYAHPQNKITEKAIAELCQETENIFDLADFIVTGQKDKAFKELHKLLEKDHPLKLIATLQTVARKWLKIKIESNGKGSFDIARTLNTPENIIKRDMQKLKTTNIDSLINFKNNLATTEFAIKSGEIDAILGLEKLIYLAEVKCTSY